MHQVYNKFYLLFNTFSLGWLPAKFLPRYLPKAPNALFMSSKKPLAS